MQKAFRLVAIVTLMAATSAHGQYSSQSWFRFNALGVNWSNFKGAKTIRSVSPNSAFVLTLNEQGKVMSEDYFHKGTQYAKTTYKYDAQGHVAMRNRMDGMDTKSPKQYQTEYHYTYTPGKCEEMHIDETGRVTEKIVALLNAKGERISETYFNADGVRDDAYEYTYDNAGNQTSILKLRTADEQKNNWPDSILCKSNVIQYDNHNNPVVYEIYNVLDKATSTTHFAYVFDDRHNWIKRVGKISHASGKTEAEHALELEIAYY